MTATSITAHCSGSQLGRDALDQGNGILASEATWSSSIAVTQTAIRGIVTAGRAACATPARTLHPRL